MTQRFRTAFMAPSGFVATASGPPARSAATATEPKGAAAGPSRKLPHVAAFRMPRDPKKTAAA